MLRQNQLIRKVFYPAQTLTVSTPWMNFPAYCDSAMERTEMLHWGFMSPWFKTSFASEHMFFLNLQTVETSKKIYSIFKSQRCLVQTSGFIWRKSKQNEIIQFFNSTDEYAYLPALFESAFDLKTQQTVKTFTILTRSSLIDGELVQTPIILPQDFHNSWLRQDTDPRTLLDFCKEYEVEMMSVPFPNKAIFSRGTNLQLLLSES